MACGSPASPSASLEEEDVVAEDLPAGPEISEAPDPGPELAAPPEVGEPDVAPVEHDVPADSCGDGIVDPGEACDDGNQAAGDWCAADCGALIDVGALVEWNGHRSYDTLTTSNGFAVATWTGESGGEAINKLDRFLEHPYLAYDEGQPTLDLLYDAYFGLRRGGVGTWLDGVAPTDAGYVPGTGVARVRRVVDGLELTTWAFVPFHGGAEDVLVMALEVHNPSGAAIDAGSVHALWNLHLGGEGDFAGEAVAWREAGYLTEWRGTARVVYRDLVPGGQVSADNGGHANNPWQLVTGGAAYDGYVEPEVSDDLAVGFESPAGLIAAGETRWFGSAMAFGRDVPEAALWEHLAGWIAGRDPEAIVAAEVAWWEGWHASETPPPGLGADETAVYRQSTAVLKMSQVRETAGSGCPSDRCHGQILASLVPGAWSISWVRDAAYAIEGLIAAGHTDEARDALRFMLRAELRRDGAANYYQKRFIESDDPTPGAWGLGVPLPADYAISVARYFGRGLEESDANAAGPNIEWDNWGLFLWAFADYVEASEDEAFLAEHWPVVSERVADLLIALVDPATGLLRPDSSIWERHWCPHGQCDEPETRKHHGYSAILASHGLARTADLAERLGDEEAAARYRAASADLAAAVRAQLTVTPAESGAPALAGNLEELSFPVYYLDVSVVEAINLGIVHPGSVEAFGTIAAFDTWLGAGAHSPGYVRTDDPTWYDGQEWVVMDLRVASALARMGQVGRARTLVGWVVGHARHNHDLVGELLSDGVYQPGSEDERWQPGQDAGADYQGAVPMCGFGPGALILALHDLY